MAGRPDDPIRSIDWGELISIDGLVTLRQAAAEMVVNGVAALVVVRSDGAPALFTERDITWAVASGIDPDATVAADLAEPVLVTADTEDSLETIARRLLHEGVRHIPVVRDDEIVTVLSIRDVLGALIGTRPASPHGHRLEER